MEEQCHLISWNVAGLKTTLSYLDRFCPKGFQGWLERQRADIVCLQEVKLSREAIANEPKKHGAKLDGYETFWCFNDGRGGQRTGLNGVTTVARRGLVIRADGAPLGDPSLDAEGRCLLTDHGSFVIFNVYVPNAGNGSRLPFKQRWLEALRRAMAKERAKGKAVILAGDLNMKHRPIDYPWQGRPVTVPAFLAACARLSPLGTTPTAGMAAAVSSGAAAGAGTVEAAAAAAALLSRPDVERFVRALKRHWPRVRSRLLAKQHRAAEYKNAKGEAVAKWRVVVTATDSEDPESAAERGAQGSREVTLGKPFWSEADAEMAYCLEGSWVDLDGTISFGAEPPHSPSPSPTGSGDGGDGGASTFSSSPSSSSPTSSSSPPSSAYRLSDADTLCLDDLAEVLEKVAGCSGAAAVGALPTLRHLADLLDNSAFRTAQAAATAAAQAAAASSSFSSSSSSSSSSRPAPPRPPPPPTARVDIGTLCGEGDGMVDAFAHFFPHAKGRATCWHQQMNCRYSNLGGRIDYTLVDGPFFAAHALRGAGTLDCGERRQESAGGHLGTSQGSTGQESSGVAAMAEAGVPAEAGGGEGSGGLDPNSSDAALAACTLRGYWKAVPMSGGGLVDAPQWCYDHHFRPPATGMIYTPPQYSDHIAVSLLLAKSALSQAAADTKHATRPLFSSSSTAAATTAKQQGGGGGGGGGPPARYDAATRRCQPHAATADITSFFSKMNKGAPATAGSSGSGGSSKSAGQAKMKRKAGGISAFFTQRKSKPA